LVSWVLLLLYSTITICMSESLANKCAHTEHTEPSKLPSKMKIPPSFMVSSVFTDWIRNSTMIIDEIRNDTIYAIETTTRNGKEKWSSLGDQLLHIINDTNCSVVNEPVIFSLLPDIASTFSISPNVTSLAVLANAILDKNFDGNINGTRVVSGVEGVGWIVCLELPQSAVVAVEVVYAGENSIMPPSFPFNNPVILSLALTYYTNASDNDNVAERVSLDFSPFRQVLDLDRHLEIAHGVVCNGLDQQSNISITFPENFEVIYSKMDSNSNSEVTSKLTYDKESDIIGESVIDGWATLLNKSFRKEDYFVVHDITRKTEFVFSSSPSCSIRLIPEETKTSALNEFTPVDLFFPLNFSSLNFSLHSNVSLSNMRVLEYRANYNSSAGNKVVEAILHQSKLSTVSIYSEGALQSIMNMAVKNKSMPYGDSVNLAAMLRGCFNSSSSNMVSFILNGVCMDSIWKWREDAVSNVIANDLLLNASVNISPYRLSFAYIEDAGGDGKNINTRVILKVAERMEGSPEMTASQVVDHLRKLSPKISFKISDTVTWETTGDGLVPYPPPPPVLPPSFNGYTSGSMLVMAIFMVMFGVAFGAGGVYVMLRRQRISTLAYQVFE
ncbi:hypothetical protein PENTCL1PPCAC_22780, partial [Pristionchus entomophagus]